MGAVRSERGSLPIVMLAMMILGSLVTLLVGTVVVGQGQTRFDQSFEQSLQFAETGLDRMVHLIESHQREVDFSLPEATVPGGRYSGVADRTGSDWQLTATGVAADGTRRTVTVKMTIEGLFRVAAFGRTLVEWRGTNSADSFRSGTFDSLGLFSVLATGTRICKGLLAANPFASADSGSTRMCQPTGHGAVATNGEMYLLGGVIDVVDVAEVHYAREGVLSPLPGARGFCSGVTAACTSPKMSRFRQPIELEPDPVVPPSDLVNSGAFTGATLPAGRQLYTNVTLDRNTVIQGTPANPSIVYLTGTLTVPNGEVVNFQRVGLDWIPKPSPGLLIFSAGIGPALKFGNHASFAGAVYAPRATFSGGSAGNIYGSIMTGSISTQGNWNFHYDDALGTLGTAARYVLSDWAEL